MNQNELQQAKKVVCVYHKKDLDGMCSGQIVRRFFAHLGDSLTMVPWDYGLPFPWDSLGIDTVLVLVDVSLPMDLFEAALLVSNRVVWLDHHRSAIKDFLAWSGRPVELADEYIVLAGLAGGAGKNLSGTLTTGEAACSLAWKFFHPGEPIPPVVRDISAYDCWSWKKLPDEDQERIKYLIPGLYAQDLSPASDTWDVVLLPAGADREVDGVKILRRTNILEHGKIITEFREGENKRKLKGSAFPCRLGEHLFLAFNGPANSTVFDLAEGIEEFDGGLTFMWNRDRWRVSLYRPEKSKSPDLDLGTVARGFGGGGHPGAAGFELRFWNLTPILDCYEPHPIYGTYQMLHPFTPPDLTK